MRYPSAPISKILYIVMLVSLLSGIAASAAPGLRAGTSGVPRSYDLPCPPAKQAHDNASKPVVELFVSCCYVKTSPVSGDKKVDALASEPVDPCCLPPLGKLAAHGTTNGMVLPPCELPPPPPPAPDGSCGIPYAVDAVVGDLPISTQAYWAPGKPALGVTINSGKYWVQGVATAENGDKYYQIIVACQKLYIPVDLMQKNYEAPWNGEALPTTEVS